MCNKNCSSVFINFFITLSIFKERFAKLISTKTGLNPFFITETTSDDHVRLGKIISFFFVNSFKLFIVIKFAEDPELTNTEYFTPSHFDHLFSNSLTFLFCVRIG